MLDKEAAELVERAAASTARQRGPWLSFFTPSEMTDILMGTGFSGVTIHGPDDTWARYLRGRADGARVPGYNHIAKATVAARR